ncbi:MAG: NADH-quinone oxidoreductase subunit J [Conexivisphaerales archaeon]
MDFIIPLILIIFSSFAAILSLESRSLVYGAISLAIFFIGLSLFFFYLGLTYLAIFQVAVYVGAIAVLIMFTVMVVGEGQRRERSIPLFAMGLLGGLIILASFLMGISYFYTLPNPSTIPSFTISSLARFVMSNYGLVVLVLALLLTSAAYGAIALARREVEESG